VDKIRLAVIVFDMLILLYALIAVWTQTIDTYEEVPGKCSGTPSKEYTIVGEEPCKEYDCGNACKQDRECMAFQFTGDLGGDMCAIFKS
jgi:hypothetical protein